MGEFAGFSMQYALSDERFQFLVGSDSQACLLLADPADFAQLSCADNNDIGIIGDIVGVEYVNQGKLAVYSSSDTLSLTTKSIVAAKGDRIELVSAQTSDYAPETDILIPVANIYQGL